MLIVALLLKSVGYSGHIVNLDKFAYRMDEERFSESLLDLKKRLTEPYIELQQALEGNDTARFKEVTAKVVSILGDYKMKSFSMLRPQGMELCRLSHALYFPGKNPVNAE